MFKFYRSLNFRDTSVFFRRSMRHRHSLMEYHHAAMVCGQHIAASRAAIFRHSELPADSRTTVIIVVLLLIFPIGTIVPCSDLDRFQIHTGGVQPDENHYTVFTKSSLTAHRFASLCIITGSHISHALNNIANGFTKNAEIFGDINRLVPPQSSATQTHHAATL